MAVLATAAFNLNAQGTAQDYKRAYSLYEKFKADNVLHSVSNVAWKDSSTMLGYNIHSNLAKIHICAYSRSGGYTRFVKNGFYHIHSHLVSGYA